MRPNPHKMTNTTQENTNISPSYSPLHKDNITASTIELDELNFSTNQTNRLEALNNIEAYKFAQFERGLKEIYFTNVEDYDALLNYLRAVAAILPELNYNVEIEDGDDEDAYWIILIKDGGIKECFGTVIWDTDEDREVIKDVLSKHVETDEETLTIITQEIMKALRREDK